MGYNAPDFDGHDETFTMGQVEDYITEREGVDVSDDEAEVLKVLNAFVNDDDTPDDVDVEFVHDDAFVEYAKEWALDAGVIRDDAEWPCDFIDWDAACEELKSTDYVATEFQGQTYWYHVCYYN